MKTRTEINKEVFEISRAIAQLTVYKVNRQVRARIAKLTEEIINEKTKNTSEKSKPDM
jgi:hypothetical protein